MKVKDLYEFLEKNSREGNVYIQDEVFSDFFSNLKVHKDNDGDLIITFYDDGR